jgi:hypothetical protein
MIASFALLTWKILGAVCACLSLPGSVELLVLSVAAMVPLRRRLLQPSGRVRVGAWRVAVVVPAHNEEVGIKVTVRSLLEAEREARVDGAMEVGIFVIADNCTDTTAAVARAAGATVLERTNAVERGKGYALDFAFPQVLAEGYDCVLVVDADTWVASNFIAVAGGAMRAGADGVQTRDLQVDNLGRTLRTRLMGLALRAFNIVRPLGRRRLGLSTGIFGNGFGLHRKTIEAVPYTTASVVEDLEYHLTLVRTGLRIEFLNGTTVFSEMPGQGKAVKTQRSRWEGGRLQMLFGKGPGLLGDVLRGRMRCLEPLLDLLLLPLAFHALLLLVCLATPVPVVRDLGVIGVAIVLLHLIAAIVVGGGEWQDLVALGAAPFYVFWKVLMIPSMLRSARPKQEWVRTDRSTDSEVSIAPDEGVRKTENR